MCLDLNISWYSYSLVRRWTWTLRRVVTPLLKENRDCQGYQYSCHISVEKKNVGCLSVWWTL